LSRHESRGRSSLYAAFFQLTHASNDVAIVGAGIAGLAAAFELQQRGLTVRVLEASDRAGGVIATERFDGWVIDAGPDSLLVQKPAAVALCRELGIADRLVSTLPPRTAYILREGTLHPIAEGSFLGFPISAHALATASLFTPGGRLRMALEIVMPRGDSGQDESVASFVRRRFGQEAVDYIADPLLAGIHAGDADKLSMRSLFPRLVDAERQTGSVIRAFRALRVKPSPQGAFVSLPGGIAELVETIVAALAPGTLVFHARATDVRRTHGYVVDTAQGPVRARALVVATPAYAAGALLRGVDTTLAGLCERMSYASTATVAFGYRRDQIAHPMRGSGFVVPSVERQALLAGTWVTSKWPGRAPEGHALLRGFLGGGRDPKRLDRPDAELIETAREELTDLLGIRGSPLFTRLYRWTKQSPQYEVGHQQRLAAIEERVAAIPGLFVTGSGFRAIGIPDCIADGREIAARASDFLRPKG
jgi:oxygen-dependent protoporphyrinogen oxidase